MIVQLAQPLHGLVVLAIINILEGANLVLNGLAVGVGGQHGFQDGALAVHGEVLIYEEGADCLRPTLELSGVDGAQQRRFAAAVLAQEQISSARGQS